MVKLEVGQKVMINGVKGVIQYTKLIDKNDYEGLEFSYERAGAILEDGKYTEHRSVDYIIL